MPSAKQTLVITDASCLILLDKIGQLNLLPEIFNEIVTTPKIAGEFGKSIPAWLKLIAVKDHKLQDEFALIVDEGEASAIALAQEIDIDYLVTDDLQARKLATKLGINIIGTLGILLKAKQAGHIALLRPIFDQIKQTDFRVTQILIDTVLKDAGE